jgi:hypothetical protein
VGRVVSSPWRVGSVLAAFLAPGVAVAAGILKERPYFGTLDDWNLLQQSGPILSRSVRLLRVDVSSWGMVRPFYPALAEPYYALGNHSPLGLYLANWATVVAILALLGFALVRALRVPAERRHLFLAGYGVACFAYPWTMYLFSIPSLQEKWILLAGALVLFWVGEDRAELRRRTWAAATVCLLLLGFLVKAQFAIFVPVGLVLLAASTTDRVFRMTITGVTSAVAVLGLAIVARHGAYTSSKWRVANVSPQLKSSVGLLFAGSLLAWLVIVGVLRRRSSREESFRLFIPAAGLAAYMAIFLPWPLALKSYPSSVAVFAFGAAVGLLTIRMPSRSVAWTGVVMLGVLAVAWSAYRGTDLFGRLASVGAIARSTPLANLAAEHRVVYLACPEPGHAIAYYVKRERGLQVSIISPGAARAISDTPVPRRAAAVISGRDCPAPLGSSWRLAWTSGYSNGLALYERR